VAFAVGGASFRVVLLHGQNKPADMLMPVLLLLLLFACSLCAHRRATLGIPFEALGQMRSSRHTSFRGAGRAFLSHRLLWSIHGEKNVPVLFCVRQIRSIVVSSYTFFRPPLNPIPGQYQHARFRVEEPDNQASDEPA